MKAGTRQATRKWGWWARGSVLAAVLALLVAITSALTPGAAAATGDWPGYLSNAGTGYNGNENLITPLTVPQLKLHWAYHGTTCGSGRDVFSAQPVTANNLVYIGDWCGIERAFSPSGQVVWHTDLHRTIQSQCAIDYLISPGIVSTATVATIGGRSMLFVGGGDAKVYALDALTGTILWSFQVGSSPQNFVWSSPAVYNGSVYVGVASFTDCPLVRGKVLKLNAATGGYQAEFDTVPSNCAGGTVWGSPTIDGASGYVYVATGGFDYSCALSSQPYAASVVKLNASNLFPVDHWQVPLGEQVGDGDFGNTPTLFNAGTRSMVGVAYKNGTYYAFDRNNISAGPVWRASIAAGGVQPLSDEGSISPSAFDGSRLYVSGGYTTINGQGCYGSLRALNPSTGGSYWQHCMTDGPVFGAVSAVRGLVVVGEGPSIIMVSASSGSTVFRYRNPTNQWFYGGASISHGSLYQASNDGTLFAFGL